MSVGTTRTIAGSLPTEVPIYLGHETMLRAKIDDDDDDDDVMMIMVMASWPYPLR